MNNLLLELRYKRGVNGLIRIWTGTIIPIQENSFDRKKILEKYKAFEINRTVKFVIRNGGRTVGILDYRDILLKRTIRNNMIPKSPMVFEEAAKYFHTIETLYSGSALGVMSSTGSLEFILEYFDNNNFIERRSQHYYKWFYDQSSKYCYDTKQFENLFYQNPVVVFQAAEEYTIHLATLLLSQRQRLSNLKVYFLDKRARYFFSNGEITILSSCDQIPENTKYLMIVTGKDAKRQYASNPNRKTYQSVEIMVILYATVAAQQQNPHSDKSFMIYNDPFTLSGMVDIMRFNVPNILLAKDKGNIPVISITDNITYTDGQGENVWEYYFENMDGYTVDQAYASGKYSLYSRNSTHMLIHQVRECNNRGIYYDLSDEIGKIKWKPEIARYCESEVPKEFTWNKKILGVIARGTDYNRMGIIARDKTERNVKVNSGVAQLIEATKKKLETEHYDYIYLATEDYYNYSEYVKAFGDKVIATNQERIDLVKNKQYASEPYIARIPKVKSGFEYGLDYLVVLTCLAKCDALLSSMYCGAYIAAVGLNKHQYKDTTVVQAS